MSIPLPALQNLLLDMLGTARNIDTAMIASLPPEAWAAILAMASEHRVGPLLAWRLSHEHASLQVPGNVRDELDRQFRASAMHALLVQRELILVHRLLEKAGIPHLALKGAYLAWFSYPHPALRPLRDLDLLIPEERALEAFECLLRGGLIRHHLVPGNPEAALIQKKHLPAIMTPDGRIWVELHTRLSDPGRVGMMSGAALHGMHARKIAKEMNAERLEFLSPTDLLLHLIVHAVHDHRFSNGPLTMSDLACVLQNDAIDWPAFWDRAAENGATKGAILTLKMADHYHGPLEIDWGQETDTAADVADELVEAASRLSLRDMEAQGFSNLKSARMGKQGLHEKIRPYLARLFPPKQEIASRYPVAADSLLVYLRYPAWWSYVARKVWRNAMRRDKRNLDDETESLLLLDRWLDPQAFGPRE